MRGCIQFFVVTMLLVLSNKALSQGPTDSLPGDPGAIAVYNVQDMKFGAFSIGSGGGNILIGTNGARSFSGNVVLLNLGFSFCQAVFDVEAPAGTIISILNGPDITLTGSNGGTMSLQIGASDPGSPFFSLVEPPDRTTVNIAGTLTTGDPSVAVPGNYTGTFYITFNNE